MKGQVVSDCLTSSVLGLARISAHLALTLRLLSSTSGWPHFRMIAETAAHSLLPDGAVARSEKGTPGRRKGTMGHCHGTVGFGITGNVPSYNLIPGHPANLLSGASASSSALAGKRRMTNLTTMPRLPSDELESWQFMRAEKSPTPCSLRSSARTTSPVVVL